MAPTASVPSNFISALPAVGDLTGIPAVKGILGIGSVIAEAAQAAKRNRQACLRLAGMVAETLNIVQRELDAKHSVSDAVLRTLAQLHSSLEDIKTYVQKQSDISIMRRVFSADDPAKELQHDLRMALSTFQLQNQVEMQSQLIRTEDDSYVRFQTVVDKLDSQAAEFSKPQGPPKTDDIRPRSYPIPTPLLFGRDTEVTELVDAITNPPGGNAARIALLGPGGIGKSSLALGALSHEHIVSMFGEHSYFVPCDSSTSASSLIAEIAAHLGISGDHLRKRLISALRRTTKAIIVLDNFETPWEDPRTRTEVEAVLTALADVPTLTIVVTMRGTERPLGVDWTRPPMKPIAPLRRDASLQAFLTVSSLSVERSPELQELLQCVDDIPLAITLVAQMAQVESPAALLARWKTESTSMVHAPVVAGSSNTDRLSSLDASIRLSLTSPRMQNTPQALQLLSLLSLLPAGLSESFQHPGLPELRKSASVLKSCALAFSHGNGRIRVLCPIRMYMLAHHPPPYELIAPLEPSYTGVAGICAKLESKDTPDVLAQVMVEAANVESLCLYVLDHWPAVDWPIPVICRFDEFLFYSGLPSGRLLERASATARRPEHRLQVLMRRIVREPSNAGQKILGEEALDLSRTAGLRVYEAEALARLGASHQGKPSSLELLKQGLAIFEELGDNYLRHQAWCLDRMSNYAFFADDYAAASSYAEESVRRSEACGAVGRALHTRILQAHIHIRLGALRRAAAIAESCVRAARWLDNTRGLADALTCRAGIATACSDIDEALELHTAASALFARRGDPINRDYAKLMIVPLLVSRREIIAARNMLEEALPVLRTANSWAVLMARCSEAELALVEGDYEVAQAHALTALSHARARKAGRVEARIREMLGDIELERERVDDATTHYVLALLLYARLGNMLYLIPGICKLGKLLILRNDCDTANGVFHWGLEWAKRCGLKAVQAGCLVGLAETQDLTGEPDPATWTEALHMSELAGEQMLVSKCEARLLALKSLQ